MIIVFLALFQRNYSSPKSGLQYPLPFFSYSIPSAFDFYPTPLYRIPYTSILYLQYSSLQYPFTSHSTVPLPTVIPSCQIPLDDARVPALSHELMARLEELSLVRFSDEQAVSLRFEIGVGQARVR